MVLFFAEREDIMVINSSNINMESKREFATERIAGHEFVLGDSVKEHTDNSRVQRSRSPLPDRETMRSIRSKTIEYIFLRIRELLDSRYMARVQGPHSGVMIPVNLGSRIGYWHDYEVCSEEENTSFDTEGTVVTADGRRIEFGISVNMTRSFTKAVESYNEIHPLDTSRLVDPLVINLNGNPPSVSNQRFTFDIDSDGEEDSIASLGYGSGFLALDRNGDGIINNGNELFGTKSGDGFADLSVYDEDHNGWIDEADSIFSKLRIWAEDKDGNRELYTLKDLNIGALCTGSVDTQFTETDEEGGVNAVVRRTGMFLFEDGMAGTMNHLDFSVNTMSM